MPTRERPASFLDALARGPLVGDGGVGTELYQRGVFINKSLEGVCLDNPTLVRRVHTEYVEAGAELIETHTFAANRFKLQRHGLEGRIEAINRAAVELALEASAGRAFVGGAVGPTGVTPGVMTREELERVRAAYREQIDLLARGGVDVLVLETFRLLSELRVALQAAREVCDLPVIAQVAFDSQERTSDGADPSRVVSILKDEGAAVVGANCLEGPKLLFNVVEKMVGRGVPVSVMPNAGYPRFQDGRMIYMATPEYFGVYARRFYKIGVALVGGCCGTGPEHVRRIAGAARMMGGGRIEVRSPSIDDPRSLDESRDDLPAVLPLGARTPLGAKIQRALDRRVRAASPAPVSPDNFVVSVEVNPPMGLDPSKALKAARLLQAGGVDAVNIADGPRASVRMSNQALAILIRKDTGLEVILHVCCRDRNLLGLQSDLLANHVLDLHNLVVITGDPPKLGDYPHATAVFDLDSVGLMRLIQGMNRAVDPAGRAMDQPTRFLYACGAEPAALDYDRELRRLELKRAAGAEFIMTQPVYDPDLLQRFLADTRHLNMPVLVGLLPLVSYRNAEFLHNEVPGMRIPEPIRARMQRHDRGPEARAEGIRIAQEALLGVVDQVVGAYIMPPFGRYAMALSILECVGYNRHL